MRPSHWAPRHHLRGSSKLPGKLPTPQRWTSKVVAITSLGIIYTFCGGKSTRLLGRRAYDAERAALSNSRLFHH